MDTRNADRWHNVDSLLARAPCPGLEMSVGEGPNVAISFENTFNSRSIWVGWKYSSILQGVGECVIAMRFTRLDVGNRIGIEAL